MSCESSGPRVGRLSNSDRSFPNFVDLVLPIGLTYKTGQAIMVRLCRHGYNMNIFLDLGNVCRLNGIDSMEDLVLQF